MEHQIEERFTLITGNNNASEESLKKDAVYAEQIEEQRRRIINTNSTTSTQLDSVRSLRRLLSIERNPPIQQVIDSGLVPYLVRFMDFSDNTSLQIEAAWAITNIASGTTDHLTSIIEAGAVPILIRLCASTNEDIQEQVVWALGNIVGDCVKYRDFVLSAGGLQALLEIRRNQHLRLYMVRIMTWTFANLCRGIPSPNQETIQTILTVLVEQLQSHDFETCFEASEGLNQICGSTASGASAVVNAGVLPRLMELLESHGTNLVEEALVILNKIVSRDESSHIDLMIHLNQDYLLTRLLWLLDSPKSNISQNACMIISRITAGTTKQIQAVINAGIIPKLLKFLEPSEEVNYSLQKEAACAISNAVGRGNPDQIWYIIQQGAIPRFFNLLYANDILTIRVGLEGLQSILEVGRITNQIDKLLDIVSLSNGMSTIKGLVGHENVIIARYADQCFRDYLTLERR